MLLAGSSIIAVAQQTINFLPTAFEQKGKSTASLHFDTVSVVAESMIYGESCLVSGFGCLVSFSVSYWNHATFSSAE